MAGIGAVALSPTVTRTASAQAPELVRLEAKPAEIALRPGQPATPIWELQGPAAPLRLKGGERRIIFRNALPVAALLDWHGMDGAAAAEPLTARPPVAPGMEASFALTLRRAGTFFCDVRLLGDGEGAPSRLLPLVVSETDPVPVDRDQLFVVEDWRLRPDGTALSPGVAARDVAAIYTVNGQLLPDISSRCRERLRFRFINGCQRNIIAVKIEGHEVRVIALDGAPAEPFAARNNAVVLAPGGRIDALIDAAAAPGAVSEILLHDGVQTHSLARLVTSSEPPIRPTPLPDPPALSSPGLPAQLDLKGALRVDLALEGDNWVTPTSFTVSAPPAFQARTGRTVVLALGNHAGLATVFHLRGHHFRLLDRLDDGWKPFWLDTLAVEPGQTQRVAFAAEFAGRFLLESTRTDWAAPRLLRWYSIE